MTHKINIDRLRRVLKKNSHIPASHAEHATIRISIAALRSIMRERDEWQNAAESRQEDCMTFLAERDEFRAIVDKYSVGYYIKHLGHVKARSALLEENTRLLRRGLEKKWVTSLDDSVNHPKHFGFHRCVLTPAELSNREIERAFDFMEEQRTGVNEIIDMPTVDDILEQVKEDFDPALGAKVVAEIAELRDALRDIRRVCAEIVGERLDSGDRALTDKLDGALLITWKAGKPR